MALSFCAGVCPRFVVGKNYQRGFRSDLASIPRLFWAIIASFELSLLAPIMHDLIYRSGGRVILPHGEVTPTGRIFERKEADDLFLELMTRAKVAYWKRPYEGVCKIEGRSLYLENELGSIFDGDRAGTFLEVWQDDVLNIHPP